MNIRTLLARFRRSRLGAVLASVDTSSPREIFQNIYHTNYWGNADSRSGAGSDLDQTAEIRRHLPLLIKEREIGSMLDIPCGDWHWMKEVTLDLDYIGADIVPELIERNKAQYGDERHRFVSLDLTKDSLPNVDLVFSRDVLVHLSFADIFTALSNLRCSGSAYLLTTTFTARKKNADIRTGQWRPLNLQKPPFNFSPPLSLIVEKCTEGDGSWGDKSLGLWKIRDLGL